MLFLWVIMPLKYFHYWTFWWQYWRCHIWPIELEWLHRLVMGPGQPGSGWVSHLWFGFEFGKFPLKTSNFSIFPFGSKKSLWVGSNMGVGGSASYLLQVKSLLGSDQGPSFVWCMCSSHLKLLEDVSHRPYWESIDAKILKPLQSFI